MERDDATLLDIARAVELINQFVDAPSG